MMIRLAGLADVPMPKPPCDLSTAALAAPPPSCHYEGSDACSLKLVCATNSTPIPMPVAGPDVPPGHEYQITSEIPWWLSGQALSRVGGEHINVFGFAVPIWLIGVAVIGGGIFLLKKKG